MKAVEPSAPSLLGGKQQHSTKSSPCQPLGKMQDVTGTEYKSDLQKLGKIPERYSLERYSPARNMELGWRTGWVSFVFLNRGQTTLIQMGMET